MSDTKLANDVAALLVKAQAEFGAIKRDGKASVPGQGTHKYATLDEILQHVIPKLTEHGLALVQSLDHCDEKGWYLKTSLYSAKSSSHISSVYPLPSNVKPRDMGSAITYARRYSISALLCLSTEDDNDAQNTENVRLAQPKKRASPKPRRPLKPPRNKSKWHTH